MRVIYIIIWSFMIPTLCFSQTQRSFELDQDWVETIHSLAPSKPSFIQKGTTRVLVFSKHTGFEHWVIPHTESMVLTLMNKVGGYQVETTKDISYFNWNKLKDFDVVVLNNNCSKGEKRNLFWDVLRGSLDSTSANKRAAKLEKNLLKFARKGGGIMTMHGGIVMQNNSRAFSQMMGGSFHYHPKQQELKVEVFDKEHELTKAFSKGYFVHIDEPYVFNGDYVNKNFRPLLYYKAKEIEGLRNPDGDKMRFNAWIKRYGKGRIFYSSPSHNAQSFANKELLQFFLNGLQYVSGDIDCNDTPIGL